MNARIYLVTPCRNAAATLDATVWSIVSQAGGLDIFYHVQDGDSTDGTQARLQDWSRRIAAMADGLPSRVRFSWDSRPDKGMYDALNRGVAALGIPPDAFMGWCNADDALWPGALDAVTSLGDQHPGVDWVMGTPTWLGATGRLNHIAWQSYYPTPLLAQGLSDGIHWPFVQQESTFWRKRLWDLAGGVDPGLRLAGDWNLWRTFASRAPLVHAARQLGSFCVRPGQLSADMDAYRAEMESLAPLAGRRAAMENLLRLDALAVVPSAARGDDGAWALCDRYAGGRKAVVRALLKRLPGLAWRTNLLKELW